MHIIKAAANNSTNYWLMMYISDDDKVVRGAHDQFLTSTPKMLMVLNSAEESRQFGFNEDFQVF